MKTEERIWTCDAKGCGKSTKYWDAPWIEVRFAEEYLGGRDGTAVFDMVPYNRPPLHACSRDCLLAALAAEAQP